MSLNGLAVVGGLAYYALDFTVLVNDRSWPVCNRRAWTRAAWSSTVAVRPIPAMSSTKTGRPESIAKYYAATPEFTGSGGPSPNER